MDLYLGWGEGMGTEYCSLLKPRYGKVICARMKTEGDLYGTRAFCMQPNTRMGRVNEKGKSFHVHLNHQEMETLDLVSSFSDDQG
ncbi:hypothetical protein GDO81_013693 [Engystomops pustulosus]|uniref:Uncharacterized protein n=1 Tax=Engystomops pustulosus TaxID=76066 RepID=A0AAV7B4X0_ENGPU|nr:hypothetical protein GDO81_013693 [Engystomops pustulosus]